jgi:hypothetical protein
MFMPTYSTGDPIMEGDWVRVMSRVGVWHHGIVRRLVRVSGGIRVEIANNVKLSGITATDWHSFSEGREVVLHRRASSPQVQEILARVEKSMGKTYHLLVQNCEHFASYAFTGKAESKYVQVLGLVAGVFFLIRLFAE